MIDSLEHTHSIQHFIHHSTPRNSSIRTGRNARLGIRSGHFFTSERDPDQSSAATFAKPKNRKTTPKGISKCCLYCFSQFATICIGALSLRNASWRKRRWRPTQRMANGHDMAVTSSPLQNPSFLTVYVFNSFISPLSYTSMHFHLISQYVSLSKLTSNPLSRIFPHGLGIHFGHFLLHTSIARASHRQQDLVSVLKRTSNTSTRNLEILAIPP